jgi:hypothetical protein
VIQKREVLGDPALLGVESPVLCPKRGRIIPADGQRGSGPQRGGRCVGLEGAHDVLAGVPSPRDQDVPAILPGQRRFPVERLEGVPDRDAGDEDALGRTPASWHNASSALVGDTRRRQSYALSNKGTRRNPPAPGSRRDSAPAPPMLDEIVEESSLDRARIGQGALTMPAWVVSSSATGSETKPARSGPTRCRDLFVEQAACAGSRSSAR